MSQDPSCRNCRFAQSGRGQWDGGYTLELVACTKGRWPAPVKPVSFITKTKFYVKKASGCPDYESESVSVAVGLPNIPQTTAS